MLDAFTPSFNANPARSEAIAIWPQILVPINFHQLASAYSGQLKRQTLS
jgi:hypothetical protein